MLIYLSTAADGGVCSWSYLAASGTGQLSFVWLGSRSVAREIEVQTAEYDQ